jgi:O-antigen/teichoic acid export membrane protein
MTADSFRPAGFSYRILASPRLRRIFRKGGWGIADQLLISGTNFVTMVLLGRALGPAGFGAFSLAYAILLFANSLQSGLITQPHNVLGATRRDEHYVRYTTATAVGQVFFAAAAALLCTAAAVGMRITGWGTPGLLFALAPVIVAWQLQEYVRRLLYTKTDERGAFTNDLLCYGSQTLGVVLVWRAGYLSATTTVIVLGVTSAVGFLFGVRQTRSHFEWSCTRTDFRSVTAENWRFGKWLLGGVLLFWMTTQLYPVLLAGLVSVAATGAVRAGQTILGPSRILLNALDSMFPARAAIAYGDGGFSGLHTLVRRIYLTTAPIMIGYALLVALFAKPLLRLLYGEAYVSYSWILPFIALATTLTYFQRPVRIALRGMEVTSPVFRAYLWSTAVFLTLGTVAVYMVGLIGAGLGMVAHTLVMNVVLWQEYRRRQEANR